MTHHPSTRIGLLAPPPNVVMEVEFPRNLPPDVSLHTMRVPRSTSEVTRESLYEMTTHVEAATRCLAMTRPQLIAFGCTSASFLNGLGWDRDIAKRIEEVSGVPAITTTTAIVEALRAVEVHKVLLVTPYIDEINRTEIAFLEGSGFEVVDLITFDLRLSEEIAAIPSSQVQEAIMASPAKLRRAEAVFISCTNLRTMDRIDAIEGMIDRPVITSNQATLWDIYRKAGLPHTRESGGRLLRNLPQSISEPDREVIDSVR